MSEKIQSKIILEVDKASVKKAEKEVKDLWKSIEEEAKIEVEVDTGKAEKDIKVFARDTGEELDKVKLQEIELDTAQAKIKAEWLAKELRNLKKLDELELLLNVSESEKDIAKVQARIDKLQKSSKTRVELEIETTQAKKEFTELNRRYNNFLNLWDETNSRFQVPFKKVEKAIKDTRAEMIKLWKSTKDIDKLEKEVEQLNKDLESWKIDAKEYWKAMEDIGKKAKKNTGWMSNLGDSIASLWKKAGAIGAVVVSLWAIATKLWEIDTVLTQLDIWTALNSKEIKEFEKGAVDLQKKGLWPWADIMKNLWEVNRQTWKTWVKAIKETERALVVAKASWLDFNEVLRAWDKVQKNFWVNSKKAFDILLKGYQKWWNAWNDFLDSITEYSSDIADAGWDYEKFVNWIIKAQELWIRNSDQFADAYREWLIRIQEFDNKNIIKAYDEIWRSYEDFQKWLKNWTTTVEEEMSTVVREILKIEDPILKNKLLVDTIWTKYEDNGIKIVEALANQENALWETVWTTEEATKTIEKSWAWLTWKIAWYWTQLTLFWKDWVLKLIEYFWQLAEYIQGTEIFASIVDNVKILQNAFIKLGDFINSKFWDEFKTLFEWFWTLVSWTIQAVLIPIGLLIKAFSWLSETLSKNREDVWVWGTTIQIIFEWVKGFLQQLMNIFEFALWFIWNAFKVFGWILTGDTEKIKEWVVGIFNNLKTFVINIFTTMFDTLFGVFDTSLENIKTSVSNFFSNLKTSFFNWLNNIVTSIKNFFTNSYNTFAVWFAKIVLKVTTFFSTLIAKFLKWWKDIITNLASWITGWIWKVWVAMSNLWKKVIDTLKSLPKEALKWWGNLASAFSDGIKSKINKLKWSLKSFAGSVKSFIWVESPTKEWPLAIDQSIWGANLWKAFANWIDKSKKYLKGKLNDFSAFAKKGLESIKIQPDINNFDWLENKYKTQTSVSGAISKENTKLGNLEFWSNDFEDTKKRIELLKELQKKYNGELTTNEKELADTQQERLDLVAGLMKEQEKLASDYYKELDTWIEKSTKKMEDFTKEIEKSNEKIKDLSDELSNLDNETWLDLAKRKLEIEKELAKLKEDNTQIERASNVSDSTLDRTTKTEIRGVDIDKIRKYKELVEELKTIDESALITQEIQVEAELLESETKTDKILRELQEKKDSIQEEIEAENEKILAFEEQKAQEKLILDDLFEHKKNLEEEFTGVFENEVNKQIAIMEQMRLKAIAVAKARDKAGISTNVTNNNDVNINLNSVNSESVDIKNISNALSKQIDLSSKWIN